MDNKLFPEYDLDEEEADEESGEEFDTEYKRSMKWNPELGDFVRDSSNRIVECDGYEAYAIWCYKMVQTVRDAHTSYIEEITGNDLGVDMDGIEQEDDRETVESMLQRGYTDALMVNPRTESVSNFSFNWEGDEVNCTFQVFAVDWDETVQISI
ncbi:MAG: DUF2634 domain-containing protein [Lachnospiraceae bacterium]|nr:DUF2634 domain-containing protein [Lachnospiraceae bacterium]